MEFPRKTVTRNDPARVITREYLSVCKDHCEKNKYSYIVYLIMVSFCAIGILSICLILRPLKNVKVIQDKETLFASDEEEPGWNTWHHVNEVINMLNLYPQSIGKKFKMKTY